MKTALFLATTALMTLIAAPSTPAAETVLSPRAKAMADSLRRVPAPCCAVDLTQNLPTGNAKAWQLKQSFRAAPDNGMDLAHGPRPLLSPKDPRYVKALRELQQHAFEVAPLK